jgi:hypothetical protein
LRVVEADSRVVGAGSGWKGGVAWCLAWAFRVCPASEGAGP